MFLDYKGRQWIDDLEVYNLRRMYAQFHNHARILSFHGENDGLVPLRDDAPNGMFKLFVQAGRTYYVTEEQAKYLLAITFINQSGQEVNKFTKVER